MADEEDVAAGAEPAAVAKGASGRDRLEVVTTLLLAVAAVATAWASYQATRWNGEQARAGSRTTALRIDAARAAGLAAEQTQVDVALFIQWIDAAANNDAELENFYVDRFRPEFKTAFDTWIATDPFATPGAPLSPFALDEYQTAASAEAARLDQAAEQSSATVSVNIQRASNYVLSVVLFSVALFFAGMSTRLRMSRLRTVTVVIGCVVFLGTAVWLATFPVSISV
ncbi:MAG TPA: hypothetical protein VIT64_06475 [Ilumatobacteraceae bacterium]